MNDHEELPQIDLALTIGLFSLVLGATYYCGNALKEIPATDQGLGISGLPWRIATGFLAAISLTSFLALLGKIITTVIGPGDGYWMKFSASMFDFSLYVLIVWFVMWGLPFLAAISIGIMMRSFFDNLVAFFLGLVASIPIFILLNVLLPMSFIAIISRVRLVEQLGMNRAMLIIGGCFILGLFVTSNAYIFEIGNYRTLYDRLDTLEIKVVVKGTISNTNMITASVSRIDVRTAPVYTLEFHEAAPGEYISWRDLSGLSAGVYKVKIFFHNYPDSSTLKKIWLRIRSNNHEKKQFIFRLK